MKTCQVRASVEHNYFSATPQKKSCYWACISAPNHISVIWHHHACRTQLQVDKS